jgi:hypothetical protein
LVVAFDHCLFDDVSVVKFVDDYPNVNSLGVEGVKLLALLCQGVNRDRQRGNDRTQLPKFATCLLV